jgi:hypothetical protein
MSTNPKSAIILTTTDELFLPSRIIYRVYDRGKLEAKLRSLRCMFLEPTGRWTWNYEHEAKTMGFPPTYGNIPLDRQPLLLASGYWVARERFDVYLRSTLRVTKFLLFFDKHVPRAWTKGEFLDEYNLVTTQGPGVPLPRPEDYFQDESKIEFLDFETAFADRASAAQNVHREQERTLAPLERHRLDAFYEDGEEHMRGAMRWREVLAIKQHQSEKPIRPYDVMLEIVTQAEAAQLLPEAPVRPSPPGPKPSAPTQRENSEDLADADDSPGFSCLRLDQALDREILDVKSPGGQMEEFLFSFGTCDNPVCDCRALDVWLQPRVPSDPGGGITRLQLMFETRRVHCTSPEKPRDQRLAEELTSRLSPGDWVLAQRIYQSEKADVSEPADASNLTVSFPGEVLRDPTISIQYQEVFPYARFLYFELAGQHWVVWERYCSNPDCACVEVFLDIGPSNPPVRRLESPPSPRVITEKDVTRILFDYQTGRVEVRKAGPAGAPPALDLFHALQRANPDPETRFRRRHRVLRQLHRQTRRSRPQLQHLTPQPIRRQSKVGRNEPCPCGSSKKFKQCCGR